MQDKKQQMTPKRKWARYARELNLAANKAMPATWTVTHYARCKGGHGDTVDVWKRA